MAPLLAGLLRGFLPSGSFFEPGGNGWAHPVRIARCWFQFIILHLLFGQRLCVGQFAPCHQPAVCHRTPPVIVVVDDGKRLVIRRLRVSSYVHGSLGGIIAVNALRSQLGMLDRRMVKLLIVVHPAVKVPLRPRLTGSIAAPVVIPMAVFPLGKLPGHKGARCSRIMPQRKAVSGFKGGSFQNHISLYCLQEIPPFCASGQHDPKCWMLRNKRADRGGM